MTDIPNPSRWQLRHNRIEYLHIYNNQNPDITKHPLPVQGDGDGQRNGDEIYATGIRLAGSIWVPSATKSATFRLFLVEYNDQVFGQGGDITTFNQVFHQVATSTMLDTFQHDRIKPKFLRNLKVSASDVNDTRDTGINFKIWIPLKRKLTFRQDDSPALAMGMKNKMTLMILPYDTVPTPAGTPLADIDVHATLYYKDP
jgi:hypothetical protein